MVLTSEYLQVRFNLMIANKAYELLSERGHFKGNLINAFDTVSDNGFDSSPLEEYANHKHALVMLHDPYMHRLGFLNSAEKLEGEAIIIPIFINLVPAIFVE